MWWRFLTFCILVTIVLLVVLSSIHGRPAIHLFFHRCCEENIENDQVIFENFGNNFLRERLVGADIIVVDNESFVSDEEVNEVISLMREKLNVHDPRSRINVTIVEILPESEVGSEFYDESGEVTTRTVEGKVIPYLNKISELDSDENKGEYLKNEADKLFKENLSAMESEKQEMVTRSAVNESESNQLRTKTSSLNAGEGIEENTKTLVDEFGSELGSESNSFAATTEINSNKLDTNFTISTEDNPIFPWFVVAESVLNNETEVT